MDTNTNTKPALTEWEKQRALRKLQYKLARRLDRLGAERADDPDPRSIATEARMEKKAQAIFKWYDATVRELGMPEYASVTWL